MGRKSPCRAAFPRGDSAAREVGIDPDVASKGALTPTCQPGHTRGTRGKGIYCIYTPLGAFARAYPVRREAMARTFLTGVHTLQGTADTFGIHYCTLSRSVRRLEAGGDC